jgi:antitoxin MazE
MEKRLTRIGNSLALVLDPKMLEPLGIDENTELELLTNGVLLAIAPLRDQGRVKTLTEIIERLERQYGGRFQRLAT